MKLTVQRETVAFSKFLSSGKACLLAILLAIASIVPIQTIIAMVGISLTMKNVVATIVCMVVCAVAVLPVLCALGALMATFSSSKTGLWIVYWTEKINAFVYGFGWLLPLAGGFAVIYMTASFRGAVNILYVAIVSIALMIVAIFLHFYHRNIAAVVQDIAASLHEEKFYLPYGHSCGLPTQIVFMVILGLIPLAKSLVPTRILDHLVEFLTMLVFSFSASSEVEQLAKASVSVLFSSAGSMAALLPAVKIIAYFLIASLYKEYIRAHYKPHASK